MRFLHTADWHLGCSFYGTSLIEDQAYILDQFVDLAKDTQPDVVLIAGDIYDRAVPPTEAIKLLDDVLSRLILDLEIPVILIAGNHDSPLRLQFGARLMKSLRLFVFGSITDPFSAIQLYDEAGAVCFYAMPYAEPAVMREYFGDDAISDHNSGLRVWSDLIRRQHALETRSVLINHSFVQGGSASDERHLSLGGTETVDSSCFAGFNYVALGHLHQAQTVGQDHIHYSGSLLKYSFSEVDHAKSINLVEMNAAGQCKVQRIPLRAKRDVRVVKGYLDDLRRNPAEGTGQNDFVKVSLLDRGAILDAMGKLRETFPYTMAIERPEFITEISARVGAVDHRTSDIESLFNDFFTQAYGTALTAEEAAAFATIVNQMQRADREAES